MGFLSGKTVIITGFQGVTESGETTTLGRGGSDTTAVAIAAALRCPCEIYTDVDGVYDKDPKEHDDAKLISVVTDLENGVKCDQNAKTSLLGTGGIYTKITACTNAARAGIDAVVANSQNLNVIYDILEGQKVGTYFVVFLLCLSQQRGAGTGMAQSDGDGIRRVVRLRHGV